jgi:hypothetical protein
MTRRHATYLVLILGLLALGAAGCERDTSGLQPAPGNTDPIVFDDNFGNGVDYQAFENSKLDAVQMDTEDPAQGTACLKVTVPGPSSDPPYFAGGAFTTNFGRELSGYDALTFWAKSSRTATLNVAGLGNDNTGNSEYDASWGNISLTTSWEKYVIPIPLPEKLDYEKGLFFFAEGHENGQGYDFWLDEIKFESVGTITNPRPSMTSRAVTAFVGGTLMMQGTSTIFDVGGTDQIIEHLPGYFTFVSSDESVVKVTDGVLQVIGSGSATITAKLDTVDVDGVVLVNAAELPPIPAPAPTVPAGDVISLFSNAYQDVPVDTWSADWDMADVSDVKIAGNDVKAYTNLVFAGIEFLTQHVDATNMEYIHLDIWLPAGTQFKVKLVNFGADGVKESEIIFNASSTPPLATGTWLGLEIPLAEFTGLTSRADLAQLLLSGNATTAYVDNIYFHR